jgi:hypothetical protein
MAKKVMNDNEMEKITEDTGAQLAKQPKVKVRLHLPQDLKQKLEAQEKAGKEVQWPYQAVQINGYIYQIQLGKSVEVPQSVADILEEAGLI